MSVMIPKISLNLFFDLHFFPSSLPFLSFFLFFSPLSFPFFTFFKHVESINHTKEITNSVVFMTAISQQKNFSPPGC